MTVVKIYLATSNKNKKREIAELFPEHDVVIPSDEGLVFSPEETGETFFENSLIKAKALWELTRRPVIADDSGICCDALGGAPGVYSARYAGALFRRGLPSGEKIPQSEQNARLIADVNAAIAQDRTKTRGARYVCAMTLFLGQDRFFCAEETMEGRLVERIEDARGSGGFGYDPIFYLPDINKTVAELSDDEKNERSHRGKASRLIQKIAKEVL